jgi:hypothetical protein
MGQINDGLVGVIIAGHTAAINVDGQCWGNKSKGQCGCCTLGENAPPKALM